MGKKLRVLMNYTIIFVIMLVIFCIGMITSYALPNQRIRNNIKESEDFIYYTTKNNNPIFGNYIKGLQLDSFTDVLILNTAINKGKATKENVLIRAFENSRYSENDDQFKSLSKSLNDSELYNNQEYSRYWHGIQTIIRPLLIVFNYEEIKALLMILMFILLGLTMLYIYKNLSLLHSIAFLFSMLAVGFLVASISLQYVGIFAITLISVILVNILYEKNKENLYPYLFFIIGSCATFFDLLTAPVLTLGIPLIIMILLKNKEEEQFNIKKSLFEILKISILWSISYAAMFATKWVIASIILHKNVVTTAVNQLLFRVNGSEQYPTTKIGAIKENFLYLYNKIFMFAMLLAIVTWIFYIIKHRKKVKEMKIVIILLLLALYPYVWYMTFSGHSTIHAWFTYRVQAVTVLSLLCIMIETIDMNIINNKNKKYIKRGSQKWTK